MLVPPFAWGRYYHKMLSHYILWLLTLVPEGPIFNLERLENVTTPAGQFKNCLRFSVAISSKGEHYENYKEVLHFARGIGLVRTERLKGDSPNSGCFFGIDPYYCCPTCNWTQELVSAVINGVNIP